MWEEGSFLFDVVPLHALQVTVVESGPHHEKEWVF
jgi:hypothetical protein